MTSLGLFLFALFVASLVANIKRTRDLAAQAKFYGQVINTVGDLLFVVDTHGRVVLANEAMGLFLGATPADMQGRPLADFLHGGDAAILLTQDLQLLKSGKTVQSLDFKLVNHQGETRHFNLNKQLLINGKTLIVTVASDVTALHNILQATKAEHAEITQQFERYVKLG